MKTTFFEGRIARLGIHCSPPATGLRGRIAFRNLGRNLGKFGGYDYCDPDTEMKI